VTASASTEPAAVPERVPAPADPPAPAGPSAAAPRRGTRALRGEAVVLTLVGVVLLLGVFEVAPRLGVLPRGSFPPTSAVLAELARLLSTGTFWQALGQTLSGWAIASLLAFAIGVPLGLLIGATRVGQLLARVTIDFLRPIPSVALIPLLALIFGTRPQLKIALGIFGGVFPLLFQALYGVQDVDPVARDSARSCGLGRAAIVGRVVLPSCAPFVATGARLAASVVLLLVITGEYVAGVAGIGRSVLDAQSNGAYEQMYAYVLTAGLLGLAVNGGLLLAERRLLFWHASQRTRPSGGERTSKRGSSS
jgi:ABC-type nitrate/sulfonate/bicarbonate transport system permease component